MITNLRCVGPTAARACAAYLAGQGLEGVTSADDIVTVPNLSVSSVMLLAEDALDQGWAHDQDCAEIILAMEKQLRAPVRTERI